LIHFTVSCILLRNHDANILRSQILRSTRRPDVSHDDGATQNLGERIRKNRFSTSLIRTRTWLQFSRMGQIRRSPSPMYWRINRLEKLSEPVHVKASSGAIYTRSPHGIPHNHINRMRLQYLERTWSLGVTIRLLNVWIVKLCQIVSFCVNSCQIVSKKVSTCNQSKLPSKKPTQKRKQKNLEKNTKNADGSRFRVPIVDGHSFIAFKAYSS